VRNFFYILILLTKCAFSNGPDWIKEPIKYCSQNEICVLGSGKSLERATAVAREELAKTLKVKIIGSTTFNSYSRQIRENEVVEGSVSENFNKDIEEISEEILEGTFVKETYKNNENFYILMALDKIKTGLIIKNKLLLIDENIEHLYRLGKRASLFEAIKIYPFREDLNSRYEFLIGEKIPPKITLKDLLSQKEKYFKKQTKVLFKFFDFKDEGDLKNYIASRFLELGLVQVVDLGEKDIYTIKFYFDFKKSYFNVEGFEKYQFNFASYSYNRNNIKIGMINFSTEGIGRNFNQAKENGLTKIKKFLSENINQMNLD